MVSSETISILGDIFFKKLCIIYLPLDRHCTGLVIFNKTLSFAYYFIDIAPAL